MPVITHERLSLLLSLIQLTFKICDNCSPSCSHESALAYCVIDRTAYGLIPHFSKREKVDCSLKYLSSKKENSVSDLNQTQVTACLFFIALPYNIREIESRCPQCNSRQTPGRSYWDQTHTVDNSFLLHPYVTWAHLYDPRQNHRLLNMPCEVYEIRDRLNWFLLNFSFHVKMLKRFWY